MSGKDNLAIEDFQILNQMEDMLKGLIIFAHEPVPGRVKTRLAASIGHRAAAELYEKILIPIPNQRCHQGGED